MIDLQSNTKSRVRTTKKLYEITDDKKAIKVKKEFFEMNKLYGFGCSVEM